MALGALDAGTTLILVVLVTIPIAALAFATGAGKALKEIGKGPMAIDQDLTGAAPAPVSKAVREAEIRQMLEARAYRAESRGEKPVDVDGELRDLLAADRGGPGLGGDESLREEVRGMVIARNDRRLRAGKEPLDVEAEIDRQLAELEDL
ncbi:MAG: hypothetical protein ABR536_05355 [Solirubrobacterales bacterium]